MSGAGLIEEKCHCGVLLSLHTDADPCCGIPQGESEPWESWRCTRCKLAFRSTEARFQCQCPDNSMDVREQSEIRSAQELGARIGYGRMMQLGEQLWRESLGKNHGLAGGEHAVYCCASLLVPCQCREGVQEVDHCEWCCGAGRVTKHVRQVQKDMADQ